MLMFRGVCIYIYVLVCRGGVYIYVYVYGCFFVGWVFLEGMVFVYSRGMYVWIYLDGVIFSNGRWGKCLMLGYFEL